MKHSELSKAELNLREMQLYKGQKKPPMPFSFVERDILPLKLLCSQVVNLEKAKILDYQFFKDILTKPLIPDFAGYNTEILRKSGKSKNLKTNVVYQPLINKAPSDPSTILTAMCDVEFASIESGQIETVFAFDQQLYRVVVDITWDDPARWKNFYPCIGGMHWLMSFVGSVGKLMKNTGLEPLMKSAFASVDKMLLGKRFS